MLRLIALLKTEQYTEGTDTEREKLIYPNWTKKKIENLDLPHTKLSHYVSFWPMDDPICPERGDMVSAYRSLVPLLL